MQGPALRRTPQRYGELALAPHRDAPCARSRRSTSYAGLRGGGDARRQASVPTAGRARPVHARLLQPGRSPIERPRPRSSAASVPVVRLALLHPALAVLADVAAHPRRALRVLGQPRDAQRLFDVGGAGCLGRRRRSPCRLPRSPWSCTRGLHTRSPSSRTAATVTRAGFMCSRSGMPFAFVDTSDMWFGSRAGPGIVVTLSGSTLHGRRRRGGLARRRVRRRARPSAGVCFQLAFGLLPQHPLQPRFRATGRYANSAPGAAAGSCWRRMRQRAPMSRSST